MPLETGPRPEAAEVPGKARIMIELAIAKRDDTIETLLRPKRGHEYYTEQVAKYGQQ